MEEQREVERGGEKEREREKVLERGNKERKGGDNVLIL